MIGRNIFISLPTQQFKPALTEKGSWLVILHAQRFPPHAGLLFSGKYSSLTIKEAELDINGEVLLRTISRKKIKAVFLKLMAHPVFSIGYQEDVFQEMLKSAGSVKQNQATCTTPLKSFFSEFYAIRSPENKLLFDLIKQLSDNGYIEYATACNMELHEGLELPFYSAEELNEKIERERRIYYND